MSSASTSSNLFQPLQLSDITVQHRIVHAPTTRMRADKNHVQTPLVAEYYEQRSRVPGTLLIAEATYIAQKAGGFNNTPGIWSDEQIASWKKVTDAVHANGSFIYLQIWGLGRAAKYAELKAEDPNLDYVAPSAIGLKDYKDSPLPRPLTVDEVKEYVHLFGVAASNAVHRAGFDGVEIHGANGYLVDQFIQDVSNQRTDEYGGSIENRTRFALEVVESVVKAIGQEKTALRVSPWGQYQDMLMKDPKPTFSYLVERIRDLYPNFSYIHVVEPRVMGYIDLEKVPEGQSNDFLREIWGNRPFISAGGYNRQLAIDLAEKYPSELFAFSRYFIANPDLPYRYRNDIPVIKGDRSLYYMPESTDPKGYTDYPFAPVLAPTPAAPTPAVPTLVAQA